MVWTWNVTSDRAGRAELNAPQDTVIVAWAATWEEASVRNGVTTATSWMPVRSARRSPSRDDTAELMRMLERGAQDAADTGEQRTISWQRAELAIEPALGTGGRWSSESRHRTAGLESPARSSRRPSKPRRGRRLAPRRPPRRIMGIHTVGTVQPPRKDRRALRTGAVGPGGLPRYRRRDSVQRRRRRSRCLLRRIRPGSRRMLRSPPPTPCRPRTRNHDHPRERTRPQAIASLGRFPGSTGHSAAGASGCGTTSDLSQRRATCTGSLEQSTISMTLQLSV